jgi:hypothetical protein
MLGDLHDQVVLLVVDCGVGDGDCVHNAGELPLVKRQIDDRPDDLYNPSDVHTHLLMMIDWACGSPPHAACLRFFYPFASASVPPTMSINSAVIADCLTLLYLSVRLWIISSQFRVALSIAAILAPFSPADVSTSAR